MAATLDEARVGFRQAAEVRRRLLIPMEHAICPFDIARQIGIEVWYQCLPSLAGMYSGGNDPTIIIGSDRPWGYQRMTCAHEIAHHEFKHGTRVDEYVEGDKSSRNDPEERLANSFASSLLMPRAAVARAFANRGWNLDTPSSRELFVVAGQLGVGYAALVHHLRWSIRSLTETTFQRLLTVQPKEIKHTILGFSTPCNLWVVDRAWCDRPLDVVVGDLMLCPRDIRVEGRVVEQEQSDLKGQLLRATRRGIARLELAQDDWSTFVRVMPRTYSGTATNRYLEDPDE